MENKKPTTEEALSAVTTTLLVLHDITVNLANARALITAEDVLQNVRHMLQEQKERESQPQESKL